MSEGVIAQRLDDALQLSAALVAAELRPGEREFVTFDEDSRGCAA